MNLEVKNKAKLAGEYIEQTQETRNKGILKSWLPIWVINAFQNYETILEESASQDMSVSTIPKVKDKPAVIIGSGPSLDKTAPLLGDWEGAVFACGSNALIPTRWGHQPEYICVFDAGDSLYPKLFGYNWEGSTLLCHPSISPKILQNWIWDKYYYLQLDWAHQWFTEILPLAYSDYMRFPNEKPPNLKITVGNSGCTANNAIQLAKYLGYNPLFLIGLDFGYPDKKERCTRWFWEMAKWKKYDPEKYTDREMHISDNGILTTEEQIEYKAALMAVYKYDRPQLFDCSEGIITELPKLNFKEVVEKNGRGFEKYYRGKKEIVRICDAYAAGRQKPADKGDVNRESERVCNIIERVVAEDADKDRKENSKPRLSIVADETRQRNNGGDNRDI